MVTPVTAFSQQYEMTKHKFHKNNSLGLFDIITKVYNINYNMNTDYQVTLMDGTCYQNNDLYIIINRKYDSV